jgi:Ca2+-transporting ATPase
MTLILIAAAVISGVDGRVFGRILLPTWSSSWPFVLINAVLGVVQENKPKKAIEALQEIAAATSRVLCAAG